MSYQPNPKQALFLWKLMTGETPEEREPKQSKTRPELSTKERQGLVEHGFIEVEQRKSKSPKTKRTTSAGFIVVTDQAWAWAAEAVDVEIMKSSSSVGAEALQGLLRRLLPYLQQQDIPLAALFATVPEASGEPAETRRVDSGDRDDGLEERAPLSERVESACLSLGGGVRQTRVRLSDLRQRLSTVRRDLLDETLLELQDAGRIVLYRDDNTNALVADDHAAALMVGDSPRHLVYLEA